jgi:hypothetical protein
MVGLTLGRPAASAASPTTYYAAPTSAGAGDCTTPADACSVESAVTAAQDGDTVELAGGTYDVSAAMTGTISVYLKTSITLRAAVGAKPVLDGGGTAHTVIGTTTGTTVTIDGVTVQNASATKGYGVNAFGNTTLRNSTVINTHEGVLANATMTVENSTIVNNDYFGLTDISSSTVTVLASTIAHNDTGVLGGPALAMNLDGNIIAGNNYDCGNLSGEIDRGFNIDGDGSCGFTSATGSVSGSSTIAASLGPLADNGGPTPTLALKPSSPAIGLVTGAPADAPVCGTPDQRGVMRPAAPCDAGAFQTGAVATTPTAPTFTDDACVSGSPQGASYTVPAVTGLDYFVNGSGTPATAGAHPATDGSTVTITAQQQPGFVVVGTSSWTHAFPSIVCTQPQTITFTSSAPVGPVVGDSYMVSATGGGSGNPVVFSSGSATVCSVSGSTVQFVGAGTCVIDANQAGNADYDAAPQVSQSIVVGQAPSSTPPTTTPPTTTPPTTTPPSSTPPASAPPASATSSSGGIASTGARPAALGFAAALLLLTGATLLLLGRRGKEYVAPRHR